jgi:hypothetical protein
LSGGAKSASEPPSREAGADGLDLPVAGVVVAERVGVRSVMPRREPLLLAARMQAADRDVAAAGGLSRGALARLPVDRYLDEVCAELNIGRRTFERWRTLGIAPRATRPTRNGPLRIKRSWLEEWAEDGAT